MVAQAKVSADELLHSEGRDLELEESLDLQLPFLLPDGGYSCDTVQGIPHGFREFLEPICRKGTLVLWSFTSFYFYHSRREREKERKREREKERKREREKERKGDRKSTRLNSSHL